MRLSRISYRLSSLDPRIEFFAILTWMLFYPKGEGKTTSYLYFLVLAVLVILLSLRHIIFLKNLAVSSFSYSLAAFNLVLIFSTFFSVYHFRSLNFFADIFLISFYLVLFFFDQNHRDKYFHTLAWTISLFSFLNILNHYFHILDKKSLFFTNTILDGIVSAMGVLILLYYLLGKFSWLYFILFIANSSGVLLSQSKAAFIGAVIFSLLLIILKKKIFIPILLVLTILAFIIPNPIKTAFYFSLKKDPYAFDRILIWKVPIDIFKSNPFTGVGPDNFAEVSKSYNFKQTRGPAHYFKVPRQSHSDYLMIAAENGVLALILSAVLLFFIFRKIFSPPLFDITKVLILFLMFQAVFFNILFHALFFFLIVFLLKILFERELTFISFNKKVKLFYSFLLVFVLAACYLFPFLADVSIEKAKETRNPVQALKLLERSKYFNPLNIEAYYLQARLFINYFENTWDLKYFYAALDNLKKIQRLNRHFTESYLLESSLYHTLLNKNLEYVSLDSEILSPLKKAEKYDPFNPFIKMHQAQVYFEFEQNESAKREALKALEIEPDYISALYFLHKNYNYFGDDETFKAKIKGILARIKGITLESGTYLYELFKIPEALKQEAGL